MGTGVHMAAWWRRSNAWAAIGWGGLIAGTLDILAAFVLAGLRGRGPDVVLHFIASGLLGVKAFRGGVATGALGLLCHFLIAFGAAAAYWLASRWWKVLVRQAVLCGLLYGIPLYAFTNFVIVPLSRIGWQGVAPPSAMLISVVVLMVCVGLPVGLATRRYS
jgi:hypothetical protein